MYFFALDISLSNTGMAVFDSESELPVEILSIPTSSKMEHKERLKTIADILIDKKEQYYPVFLVFESGFSRFNFSTKTLFKCLGVIEYLFYDIPHFSYAPSSIKKCICGNGKADKNEVQQKVLEFYKDLVFRSKDESDAVAIGLTHIIKNKEKKG